eukprot:7094665-Pyramimonas_sp.AAC.1
MEEEERRGGRAGGAPPLRKQCNPQVFSSRGVLSVAVSGQMSSFEDVVGGDAHVLAAPLCGQAKKRRRRQLPQELWVYTSGRNQRGVARYQPIPILARPLLDPMG